LIHSSRGWRPMVVRLFWVRPVVDILNLVTLREHPLFHHLFLFNNCTDDPIAWTAS
jgi:hypothetical protein